MSFQIEEIYQVSRFLSSHIFLKFQKTGDNKTLQALRGEKKESPFKVVRVRMKLDFSIAALETKRHGINNFNISRENYFKFSILYLVNF